MPLRQMQVHLPIARSEEFEAYLQDRQLMALWRGTDDAQWGIMAIMVVDAFDTDGLVHELLERFGQEEHFKLVLSEVAAIYPRATKDGDGEKGEDVEGEEEGEFSSTDRSRNAAAGTDLARFDTAKPSTSRIAIEELEERLSGEAALTGTYVITVLLSALVAALGLMRDNTAVVIGAMVIAPLLGPNMALALGTTLGKWALMRRAAITNGAGVSLALLFAIVLGFFTSPDIGTPEIASRTEVGYSDIALALASGVAGAIAVTTGVPAALVGVMVAVALMPPLVTAGLLFGAGEFAHGGVAILLTCINVIAVNLAAVGTFVAKGIKPRDYWESGTASRMTRIAIAVWFFLLALLAVLVWVAKGYAESSSV